jgi:hypothetical protein
MSESIAFKAQLVDMDGKIVMDIEPPLDEGRQKLIRRDPIVREIPEEYLVFTPRTPDDGEPFTEIDFAKLEEGAASRPLELDVENFAGRIAGILTANEDEVSLARGIKPLAERGYYFLNLTPDSPKGPETSIGSD